MPNAHGSKEDGSDGKEEHKLEEIIRTNTAIREVRKLLEAAGYEVVSLGADVPTNALAGIVADHDPTVVALTATMPEAGERVPAAVEAVSAVGEHIGLILGGASVPPRLMHSPQVVVERSIAGVVEAADGLVRRARLN